MDRRLLDRVEIETIWKQLSMKPLSNTVRRFAVEIALAQLRKVDSLIPSPESSSYFYTGGDSPVEHTER